MSHEPRTERVGLSGRKKEERERKDGWMEVWKMKKEPFLGGKKGG